jgi:hypothetical protein
MTHAMVADAMGEATVMTRAATTNEVVATLRSADGSTWADCTLPVDRASRESRMLALYRTDVTFPSQVIEGTRVYEPRNEADTRIAEVGGTGPSWDVDCFPRGVDEESQAFFEASSTCPTFHVVWNDRRTPEVAAARIVNPDGTTGWAQVKDGYLSYGYSAAMTPALRRLVATTDVHTGSYYGIVRDITLYDADGSEIASGTGIHEGLANPTIQNYPSLAVTLKRDLAGG